MRYSNELNRTQGRVAIGSFLLLAGALLAWNLNSTGIWDPWELDAADQARQRWEGHGTEAGAPLHSWLLGLAFQLFGVHAAAGRLPMVAAGLLTAWLAYALVAPYRGRRAAFYASLIAATSPLFVLNARSMLGATPAFAAHALWGLALFRCVLPEPGRTALRAAGWWGLAGLGAGLSISASGALLGLLPPLLAVVLSGIALRGPYRQGTWWVATGAAVAGVLIVARAVWMDGASYDPWRGGSPAAHTPPSFEHWVAVLFHGFAPWSALLPVVGPLALRTGSVPADANAVDKAGGLDAGRALGLFVVTWTLVGFATHTLFVSRYGPVSFLPLVPLAAWVGMGLRVLEGETRPHPAGAIVASLLVVLLLRDYRLYPESPLAVLGISDLNLPDSYEPPVAWLWLWLGFGLAGLIGLASGAGWARLDWRAPYRLLHAQWQRGWAFQAWLGVAALAALALLVVGGAALWMPDALGMDTAMQGRAARMMVAPLALPLAIAGGQLVLHGVRRLAGLRFIPLLLAGCAVGIYVAQGFFPGLSALLSPREAYATYNALAAADEPLAEHRVGGRSAAFYAKGEVREISDLGKVVAFLDDDARRWVAFSTDSLGKLTRSFRRRTGRHLYVADARNPRVLLAANHPVPKRADQNPLAKHVLDQTPTPQHSVSARFDNKVELLGYDISLPRTSPEGEPYAGASDRFELTWYFKTLKPLSKSYQIFVHVDGHGTRVNGDHDPVEGKYPTDLWEPGDIIVDRHELTVPSGAPPGRYTILMGFFSGKQRLTVEDGPQDGENRVRAGHMTIR